MNRGAPLDTRLRTARLAAEAGGTLARSYFARRAELAIETKGPQDLVSVADRAVETAIRDAIATAFPHDPLVGEEHGGDAADTGWVVDRSEEHTSELQSLMRISYAVF